MDFIISSPLIKVVVNRKIKPRRTCKAIVAPPTPFLAYFALTATDRRIEKVEQQSFDLAVSPQVVRLLRSGDPRSQLAKP
jgi:hypothetical protein